MVPESDLLESIQVPMAAEASAATITAHQTDPVVVSESVTNSLFLDLPSEVCGCYLG